MSKKSMYKCCVVPECKNTTVRTPNKLFFSIPVGEQRRTEWCRAMGRHQPKHRPLHPNSSRFCCEDHFDLENDMANYLKWKLVGTSRLYLKKGVLPHKFHCQNRVSSETRSQIEASPLHIKEEDTASDNGQIIYNNEATEQSVLEDNDSALEYAHSDLSKPYIVNIIYVKRRRRV